MAPGVAKVVELAGRRQWRVVLVAAGLLFSCLIQPSSARGGFDYHVPSRYVAPPRPCFEDERAALLGIKAELNDPNGVLHAWSLNLDVCPCRWGVAVFCGSNYDDKYHVTHLDLAGRGLSGTLSPRIGDLTRLQKLFLQDNAISGPIPDTIGRLDLLVELDVSNNSLNGSIPSSLGDLKKLSYMKLNNNSLSGPVPDSFETLNEATIDLSFNNLSGPLPPGALDITGNPLICGANSGDTCSSHNQKAWPQHGMAISHLISIICAAVSSIIPIGILQ